MTTDERLAAIRERLKAASPAPWEWGPDWDTLEFHNRSGGGDKYADLGLRAGSTEVLPIRIDHYEPIWDCADPKESPKRADRELIAHAPGDLAFLLALVEDRRTG